MNKTLLISNIHIISVLILHLAFSYGSNAEDKPAQSTTGDKSPVIQAGGDATVTYGVSEKQFN